jgi:hypothetical protein
MRRAAQLKNYRKAVSSDSINVISSQNQGREAEKQIEFVVNDSVAYTHFNQFKSQNGANNWSELRSFSDVIEKAKLELTAQRVQYSKSMVETDKKKIAECILDLELRVSKMERLLTVKTVQLRNDENKFILSQKSDKKD